MNKAFKLPVDTFFTMFSSPKGPNIPRPKKRRGSRDYDNKSEISIESRETRAKSAIKSKGPNIPSKAIAQFSMNEHIKKNARSLSRERDYISYGSEFVEGIKPSPKPSKQFSQKPPKSTNANPIYKPTLIGNSYAEMSRRSRRKSRSE